MGYIVELVKEHTVKKIFRDTKFFSKRFYIGTECKLCVFLLSTFNKAEISIRILVFNSTSIQGSLKYYNNNLKLELYENLSEFVMLC